MPDKMFIMFYMRIIMTYDHTLEPIMINFIKVNR